MVGLKNITSTSDSLPKKLLFILPEHPFPPRKNGFTVRFHPLLKELSKKFRIDVAILNTPPSPSYKEDLSGLVDNLIPIPSANKVCLTEKMLAQLTRLSPFGVPYELYRYNARQTIENLLMLDLEKYDSVVWACENYYLDLFTQKYHCRNLVVDAVDSLTLWKSRITKFSSMKSKLSLYKMRRWEASVLGRASKTLFISDTDANLMQKFVNQGDIQVLPNGIYIDDYTEQKINIPSPSIGYLGNMSYRPNIDAAMRTVAIYKKLKAKFDTLSLYIIGRNPPPEITALEREPGIIVTGTVDSIWGYVNGIDIFVLPMTLGAGQQNKLLEVLYAGKSAVVSSIANHGVKAKDGLEVLVRDDEDGIACCVEQLILSPKLRQYIGNAGKSYITQEYSWDKIGQKYGEALNNLGEK